MATHTCIRALALAATIGAFGLVTADPAHAPAATKDIAPAAAKEAVPLSGPNTSAVPAAAESIVQPDDKGYKIEKPGTITFTVGVVIKGKVEKPQVVIFLPKEKPEYEPFTFNKSFKEDILKPLPLRPVAE